MTGTLRPVWTPGSLAGADGVAESIAAKDLNNLYRTSCFFADADRYQAFCGLYAIMRLVDDRIDNQLAGGLDPEGVGRERRALDAWDRLVAAATAGGPLADGDLDATDEPRVNSTGRRNTSMMRCCDAETETETVRPGGSACDAFAWSAAGNGACGAATVLEGDRAGAVE